MLLNVTYLTTTFCLIEFLCFLLHHKLGFPTFSQGAGRDVITAHQEPEQVLGFGKGSMGKFTFEHALLCGHLLLVNCHEHSVAAVGALWAHPAFPMQPPGILGSEAAGAAPAGPARQCLSCAGLHTVLPSYNGIRVLKS